MIKPFLTATALSFAVGTAAWALPVSQTALPLNPSDLIQVGQKNNHDNHNNHNQTTTTTTTTTTTITAASTTTAIDIGVTATMFGPTIGRVLAASSLVQSGIARSQPIHLQQDPGLCPPAGASPHGLVDLSRRSYMDDQTPNGFGKLIISRSVFSVAHPMLSLSQGSGKSPGPLRSGLFSHSTLVD